MWTQVGNVIVMKIISQCKKNVILKIGFTYLKKKKKFSGWIWPRAFFQIHPSYLSFICCLNVSHLNMCSSVCCRKGWWECCGGSGLYGTPGADDFKLPADSAQVSSHPQGFPLHHQRHHHWQTHREGERVRMIFIFCNFYCLVFNSTTVFTALYHINLFYYY